jgi:glycosyltransferase involved in cell wall biosynthesis
MLSILIPVYNFSVVTLVSELHRQALQALIPFEIVVVDDASPAQLRNQNAEIVELSNVRFFALESNIGRARIRNYLSTLAVFPNLLFLDCDTSVPPDFVANYVSHCNQNVVVCGGIAYQAKPPDDLQLILRWTYGRKREQMPVHVRGRNPYQCFMTGNFLVPSGVMNTVQFDETITQYGHEDTVFGFAMKYHHISVVHIHNPLFHIGFENAAEFLRKTKEAVENLWMLIRKGHIKSDVLLRVRLLRNYHMLQRVHLLGLFSLSYRIFSPAIMANLRSTHPNLLAFDLYKMSILVNLAKGASLITRTKQFQVQGISQSKHVSG